MKHASYIVKVTNAYLQSCAWENTPYLEKWTSDGWSFRLTSERDRALPFDSMTAANCVMFGLGFPAQAWDVEPTDQPLLPL